MRTIVALLAVLLAVQFVIPPADAGHSTVQDPLPQVLHDCVDPNTSFGDYGTNPAAEPGNDLGLVRHGEGTRDFDLRPEDENVDLHQLVLFQVMLRKRAPQESGTGGGTDFSEDGGIARLTLDFKANNVPNVLSHSVTLQTVNDWSITPTVFESSGAVPVWLATTSASGPNQLASYRSVEIGYRYDDLFAPGDAITGDPMTTHGWSVKTEVQTDTDDDGNPVIVPADTIPADDPNCSGWSISTPVTFKDNVAPVVTGLHATPGVAHRGDTVAFSADITAGSGAEDLNGYRYQWTFTPAGTGATNVANPTITFADVGPVSASLVVIDDLAKSSVQYIEAAVVDIQNRDPAADFTISQLRPEVDESITFTSTSTDPDGDPITSYEWSVDGVVDPDATAATYTRSFATVGPKVVTLRVTDDGQGVDTRSLQLFVCVDRDAVSSDCKGPNRAPEAEFTMDKTEIFAGGSIQFTDASMDFDDGTVESWSWSFGDGTTSTDQNPTHKFTKVGLHLIVLTVTDDAGLSDDVTHAVRVKLAPTPDVDSDNTPSDITAAFELDPEAPVVGAAVTFTDATQSTLDLVQWTWFFGDGSDAAEGAEVEHIFRETGTYRVRLVVEDAAGITDMAEMVVRVGSGSDDDNGAPGLPLVVVLGALAIIAARRRSA